MEVEPALLVQPDSENADSLVSSNEPDDLANEQTWPTEDEMSGQPADAQSEIPDALDGTTPRSIRRIPKGMSEYQAAWIVDEDDEDGEDDEDEKHSTDETGMEEIQEDEEEMQDMLIEGTPTEVGGVRFEDLDVEEEEKQYVHKLRYIPTCRSSSTDWTIGETEIGRRKTIYHSLTKSIHRKIFQQGHASSVSEE